MTTNQEGVHAAVRAVTGTSRSYNEDWHALFDDEGIAAGPFNARMLAWINASLGTSYSNLNAAMQAFAVDQGFANWASMNTFSLSLAAEMIGDEPSGMAINFVDLSMVIRDTTTPANNFTGNPQNKLTAVGGAWGTLGANGVYLDTGKYFNILTSAFPYNQSEGIIFVKFRQPSYVANGRAAVLSSNGSILNRVIDAFLTTGPTPVSFNGAASISSGVVVAAGDVIHLAAGYKTAAYRVSVNGRDCVANTTAAVNTATGLRIGSQADGSVPLTGWVESLLYLPYLPSNDAIVARTADVVKTIVCDGNSLTAGSGGTPYPAQLQTTLGSSYFVRNYGVAGQTTANMASDAATQIDILPKGDLVAWEGGNDIGVDAADLATLQSRWATYFSARKAAGWGVGASNLVAMTITPRTTFSGAQTTLVNNFNTWLRANYSTYATHLVDVAADARLSNPADLTYYTGDGIHMNTAGYAVVAELVGAVVAA